MVQRQSTTPSCEAKQTYNEVFSIMKGLAIICVVAGHTDFAPVHDFVYLFHLAVFYFSAGYFFKDRYVHEKGLFIWKRIKGLWFPFWGYGLAFLLLHNVFYRLHLYPASDHLYMAPDYLKGVARLFIGEAGNWLLTPLWFVRSLFVASVVFFAILAVCKRVFKNKRAVYCEVAAGVCALALAAAVQSDWLDRLPISVPLVKLTLQRDFAIVPVLFIGRWFRMCQAKVPLSGLCWAAALVLLLACQWAGVRVEISAGEYPPLWLFFAISALGCYFVYLTAHYLHRFSFYGLVAYAGRYSFAVMALHLLFFKLVSLSQMLVYGYGWDALGAWPVIDVRTGIWWLPYTVVGTLAPLGYVWVKERLTPRGLSAARRTKG